MKKNTLSVALLATLLGLAACETKDITPAPNLTGSGTSTNHSVAEVRTAQGRPISRIGQGRSPAVHRPSRPKKAMAQEQSAQWWNRMPPSSVP